MWFLFDIIAHAHVQQICLSPWEAVLEVASGNFGFQAHFLGVVPEADPFRVVLLSAARSFHALCLDN